jgi:CelD/BcsL family acetyltransferase involved in cellulose biosynthesis
MLEFDLKSPDELSEADWSLWNEMQAGNPSLDSPYFLADFVRAVADVRRDVQVTVIRERGETVGFFPFQRGKLNLGKPVGGKLSDYHGVLSRNDLSFDVEHLLRASGLASWDFDHLVAGQQAFANCVQANAASPFLDLSKGFDEYAKDRREAGSDSLANLGRKIRKFERDQGELRFVWHDATEKSFESLLQWKSSQYRATGLADVFEFPWTTALLRRICDGEKADFGATISTLYAGERLAAACYCLRGRKVLHAWFNAYDPELAVYSPGLVLFERMARAAEEHGIAKIDLGKGDERYKRSLASSSTPLWEGSVELNSLSVWLRNGWRRTRDWMQHSSLGGVARTPGRIVQPIRQWMAYH